MARTQKNKATNAHLGLLKAKLSKLKKELLTEAAGGGGGGGGEGFDVRSTGDGRVGLVGFPSVLMCFFFVCLQNNNRQTDCECAKCFCFLFFKQTRT